MNKIASIQISKEIFSIFLNLTFFTLNFWLLITKQSSLFVKMNLSGTQILDRYHWYGQYILDSEVDIFWSDLYNILYIFNIYFIPVFFLLLLFVPIVKIIAILKSSEIYVAKSFNYKNIFMIVSITSLCQYVIAGYTFFFAGLSSSLENATIDYFTILTLIIGWIAFYINYRLFYALKNSSQTKVTLKT
jgi:hypothetical protein